MNNRNNKLNKFGRLTFFKPHTTVPSFKETSGQMDKIFRMRFYFPLTALLLLVLLIPHRAIAQEPVRFFVDREKDHYITARGFAQLWFRHTAMNPGSLVNLEPTTELYDLSLRRFRLNLLGKASERLRYTLTLGNNNVNYYTYKDFNVKLLEAYVDYQVTSYLGLGIGKQGWTGLSRYASQGPANALALDISFVSIPLIIVYDDILRRWGIYARGIVDNFDYRISLSRPEFYGPQHIAPLEEQATFANQRPSYQFSSYVKYQFFEHESHISPWMAGTYLGKKEVFNLGVGMLHQPNTTWYLSGDEVVYHPITSFAADVFYDRPMDGNKAFTLYFSYHHHNMGKNFLRNIGINNPATGGNRPEIINGPGNRIPVVGTGNILYMQAGFLLPVNNRNSLQFQPYTSMVYGMLQALDEPMLLYNSGINYYFNRQYSKISLGYENRPVFLQGEDEARVAERKAMWVLQYQHRF